MIAEIKLPDFGGPALLKTWRAAEGDALSSGDPVCDVEVSGAVHVVRAAHAGRMGRRLAVEGVDGLRPGAPLAFFVPEARSTAAKPRQALDPMPTRTGAPEPDLPRRLTMREALRDALAEAMRADPDVFIIGLEVGEAQGVFRVSQGLIDEFGPRRVVDAPVSEHAMAGLAVGAAYAGLRPVVEFMNFSFAMQAMDHIVNSAAKARYMSGGAISCPIVFRGPNGFPARVGAQHAQDFSAWFAQVPGLKVVAPSCAADARALLHAAIADDDPVVFLEHEQLYPLAAEVDAEPGAATLGKARIRREGTDATIVAWGIGVLRALEAAEALSDDGIEAEVIDLRSLRPLDAQTVLASVRRTNRCVTVEEGWPGFSVGDRIAALLMREAFDDLDAPVTACTGRDVPAPYAEELETAARVSTADVIAAVRAVCYR